MSANGLILTGLSACATVAANLLLRAGLLRAGGLHFDRGELTRQFVGMAAQPMFVAGVLLYGLASVIWFSVLSKEELSASYPLLVSMTFVLVTIGGVVCFGEHLSHARLLGIVVALAGITVIARS